MKKKKLYNYIIIIIISSSYDCAAMSVCVRRLYKMNYVVCVWAPNGVAVSRLVETIMTMMIGIETAVMAAIVGCGMMNVLIAAVIGTGQTIAAMSMPVATIAAISSVTMTIVSIAEAIDATFLRLLIGHARFQFGIRSGSRLSNGRQTVGQAHGECDEKAL